MTKSTYVLVFNKDFSGHGSDRFFLWHEGDLQEVDAATLVDVEGRIICHDYWLIAPAIYSQASKLPEEVVDIVEFDFGIRGDRIDRKLREHGDVRKTLLELCDEASVQIYLDGFYRRREPEIEILATICLGLHTQWKRLLQAAEQNDELERAISIEIPVFNKISLSCVRGIRVDKEKIRAHKSNLDTSYYLSLKSFAEKHNFSYEVPSNADVARYLAEKGFDLDGVSVDYVLQFLPVADGFSEDLLDLKKSERSRAIIGSMSSSAGKVFPIVDTQATITSRIYYRDPSLQSLPRSYRDVIIADKGFSLSYVDYDQFEVGVMAALSSDGKMRDLYATGDLYEKVAIHLFNDATMRGNAKRLFLSYAYGMKMAALLDAASALGASRSATKSFFSSFNTYETWKLERYKDFESAGKIGTVLGNYLNRLADGQLTSKEKRSCISQVVQGTASLIFKKAILAVANLSEVEIKIPMHDALLVQHPMNFDTQRLTKIFGDVMTDHFNGIITGRASIEDFSKRAKIA